MTVYIKQCSDVIIVNLAIWKILFDKNLRELIHISTNYHKGVLVSLHVTFSWVSHFP